MDTFSLLKLKPSLVLTFGLLALAVVSVWLGRIRVANNRHIELWPWMFCTAVTCGFANGYLTWSALVVLSVFALAAVLATCTELSLAVRVGSLVLVALITIGLAFHVMPGFLNPVLIEHAKFSPDAAPYTDHANFDKAAAGLLVLVFLCNRVRHAREWRDLLLRTYPIAAVT